MRNIILAFPEASMIDQVKRILLSAGIHAAAEATSRIQLLQSASRLDGGGVVILPGNLSGLPAATLINDLPEDYDLLVLLAVNEVWDSGRPGVFALRTPIRPIELLDSVRMLLETRQLAVSSTHHKPAPPPAAKAGPSLASSDPASDKRPASRPASDRRVIEQAKQVLIVRNNMSEEQAHRFLQKRSMDTGNPMVIVARQVLDT